MFHYSKQNKISEKTKALELEPSAFVKSVYINNTKKPILAIGKRQLLPKALNQSGQVCRRVRGEKHRNP